MSVRVNEGPNNKIESLRREADSCQACPLWRDATQTVFGEGPQDAEIMLVGEQPGDQEDREGRPFVGPAGLLFDKALREAGVDRKRLYVTNAVKQHTLRTARLDDDPSFRVVALTGRGRKALGLQVCERAALNRAIGRYYATVRRTRAFAPLNSVLYVYP